MSIFLVSDTHFFHEKIIQFCNRPWKTAAEMNEGMIERWNKVVRPVDTVYHLGDAFFESTPEARYELMRRLNGIIHLIKGNHDHTKRIEGLPFASVEKSREIKWNGHEISLYHYPQLSWNNDRRGAWMLHGHCHGSLDDIIWTRGWPKGLSNRILDVGVDSHFLDGELSYAPIPIEVIELYMKDRPVRTEGGF